MKEEELFDKLREIASTIIDISPDSIKMDSKQEDIPEWDSLTHLRLIMAVEEAFMVKFSMIEIPKYRTIDALITEIKHQKNIS